MRQLTPRGQETSIRVHRIQHKISFGVRKNVKFAQFFSSCIFLKKDDKVRQEASNF